MTPENSGPLLVDRIPAIPGSLADPLSDLLSASVSETLPSSVSGSLSETRLDSLPAELDPEYSGNGAFFTADPLTHPEVAVVGLGYAGLPVAVSAAAAGYVTCGIDLRAEVVDSLNAGRPLVDTVSAEQLAGIRTRFAATTDPAVLARCTVVVVCVPTPVDERGRPDLALLTAAVTTVRDHLRPGQLVIIESTTYPGTTDGVVRAVLEESGLRAGDDFALAFSPERVDPGNRDFAFHNTPKVVGGFSDRCRDRAAAFYTRLTERVHVTRSTREAEAAKILENTFRQVNIALVNEFARVCHRLGVDVWDTIDAAATKPFGFMPFRPGAGVGGHCIPVDPLYLAHRAREAGYPFSLVEAAQTVNDAMPLWVAERAIAELGAQDVTAAGARVLLLGVTYKPDVADVRHSPAVPLAEALLASGVRVSYHDPYVDVFEAAGTVLPAVEGELSEAVAAADLVVLVQRHGCYPADLLAGARRVMDATGPASAPNTAQL
ncbi:nucleotide sugar dehydrogenase [Streptomyces roseochromogenus]|uniref:UDP-glucose/GDP-mannose dehydrogenase C-terminal domain-containing protein n=1 Tax=Streptomyces roseochromogenus subsp. oscitans DS 12.976 TaxID=1352936 RepID=V6K5G2_STRRC|nr:nucleotide sugar dehydrogenase [Streptomyces roseochromogenus]EST27283.1 hypothetical protein M878_25120 [Streptomyces roseochromogenus subsp. oscitans DS 12.976]